VGSRGAWRSCRRVILRIRHPFIYMSGLYIVRYIISLDLGMRLERVGRACTFPKMGRDFYVMDAGEKDQS
jgi:hypothetical protein